MNPTTDQLLLASAALMGIAAVFLIYGVVGVSRFLKEFADEYTQQVLCTKKLGREIELSENRELKTLKAVRSIERKLGAKQRKTVTRAQ